jgi:hypothetical protein
VPLLGGDVYNCVNGRCREENESRRRLILLVDATGDNLQRVIRQRPLQGLRLVPWRANPHVALFGGREDHRHRLRMDRCDHGVRCGRQEAVDEVRSGDRLGFRAPVASEFGPDTREGEQGPVLVEREPNDII